VAYLLAGLAGRSLGELDSFVPPSPYPGRGAAAVASAKGPTSGAEWLSDYGQALAQAKAAHLPILVNFTGVTCTNCRWMEQNMFVKPEIAEELNRYVKVELYTDRETPGDDKNKDLEEKLTGVVTLPVYVALTPDGKVRKQFQGLTRDSQTFLTFLRQGRSSDLTTAMR